MPDLVSHDGITGPRGEQIFVRRSARRRRTVTITRRGGALEVAIPASFSRREETRWVRAMVERIATQESRAAGRGDEELAARAAALSRRHFEGRARPSSVTWSTRQRSRWGSCTPADGTIRISSRLKEMPEDVLDYVLVHELAHLFEGGHGPAFWALVHRYPHTERARGFLDGVSFAEQRGAEPPNGGPETGREAGPVEGTTPEHGGTGGDVD